MTEKLSLTITFADPDADGWIVARILEVPGAITQERTRAEARENVVDALRTVLAPDDDGRADPSAEELELLLAG